MRKKKNFEISEKILSENDRMINKIYDFEIITPMFGGDSESWKINVKQPVRSQSVKGQLRFWWRTMQSETDNEKLLYQENKIWGGKTDKNDTESNRRQSRVKFSIIEQKAHCEPFEAKVNAKGTFAGVDDSIFPSYVLFPITDKIKKDETIYYIDKLTFKLQISYPKKYEDEVMNTLKLWTLFGGVGARTRRGTGALYCKELLSDFNSVKDIKRFILGFNGAKEKMPYPRIIGSIFAVKQQNDEPQKVWKGFLRQYGDYRQAPGIGRGRGSNNRPGRSYWPEPDSIRKITEQHGENHEPEHHDAIWFPRSMFGLPIMTEFRGTKGDPYGKILLEPDIGTGERWPSPVIFRVIKLPNGDVYKTVLILNQQFPKSLKLTVNGREIHKLTDDEMPINTKNKIMKKNDELNGRTIYKHLIDFLKLEEV